MKKKKNQLRSLFDSIRKPVAPPTKKIGTDKPEERAHPANRKTKHKKPEETDS